MGISPYCDNMEGLTAGAEMKNASSVKLMCPEPGFNCKTWVEHVKHCVCQVLVSRTPATEDLYNQMLAFLMISLDTFLSRSRWSTDPN